MTPKEPNVEVIEYKCGCHKKILRESDLDEFPWFYKVPKFCIVCKEEVVMRDLRGD